jgi:hypothetical protein
MEIRAVGDVMPGIEQVHRLAFRIDGPAVSLLQLVARLQEVGGAAAS